LAYSAIFFEIVGNSKSKYKDCNNIYSLGSDYPKFQTDRAEKLPG